MKTNSWLPKEKGWGEGWIGSLGLADVDYYMQNQLAVLEELEKKSPRIVLEDFQTNERKYYTSTLQISREYGVDEESFRTTLMRENNPYLECKDGRKFKLYYEGNDGAK